jgi:hypothetical protein
MEMRYKELKNRQRRKEHLLPSELEYVKRVEAVVGYEVVLHLPLGSKFILGADDAEQIVNKVCAA